MPYDFDKLLDRTRSNSTKWSKFPSDVIPMWVADMDFAAPDFIMNALQTRLSHPILGYTDRPQSLMDAVIDWFTFHYGWHVPEDWLVFVPGVVPGLNLACQTQSTGAVMIPTPVYQPFFDLASNAELQQQLVPMVTTEVLDQGVLRKRWAMDFEAMRAALTDETKLLAICNPQNPTGRCYAADELKELAGFVEEHELILVSDDIHGSIVLDSGARHRPIVQAHPEIGRRSISLFAPTKAYNVPGLSCAVAVIPDEALRASFSAARRGLVPGVGPLGFTVVEAAFRDRGSWLAELNAYLAGNAALVKATLGARVSLLEATYLAWIDVRELGDIDTEAHFAAHGVGLSPGAQFGEPTHVRLNFGCPRTTLVEGLARLQAGLNGVVA